MLRRGPAAGKGEDPRCGSADPRLERVAAPFRAPVWSRTPSFAMTDAAVTSPLVGKGDRATSLRHRAPRPLRPVIVQVRAGPFAGFRDAIAFQRWVASLPDVRGVEIRQFSGMTALLRVTYAGAFPLSMVMSTLEDDQREVWVVSPTQIEVRIRGTR